MPYFPEPRPYNIPANLYKPPKWDGEKVFIEVRAGLMKKSIQLPRSSAKVINGELVVQVKKYQNFIFKGPDATEFALRYVGYEALKELIDAGVGTYAQEGNGEVVYGTTAYKTIAERYKENAAERSFYYEIPSLVIAVKWYIWLSRIDLHSAYDGMSAIGKDTSFTADVLFKVASTIEEEMGLESYCIWLYHYAMNRGHAEACVKLAKIYSNSINTDEKIKQLVYYQMAIDRGYDAKELLNGVMYDPGYEFQTRIAKIYREGKEVKQNWLNAYWHYQKGLDSKTILSDQEWLDGVKYYQGMLEESEDSSVRSNINKLLERGTPSLWIQIAELYKEGREVAQNTAEAVRWYTRALEVRPQLSPDECSNAAQFFKSCNDLIKAHQWYKKAGTIAQADATRLWQQSIVDNGNQRNTELRIYIGDELVSRGGAENYDTAVTWYNIALNDSQVARNKLSDLLNRISQDRAIATALLSGNRTWLHRLAEINAHADLTTPMQRAINRIIGFGVSPYKRSSEGKTAFQHVRGSDPHKLDSIFRPGLLPDFIGVDNEKTRILSFFNDVRESPTRAGRFLLLHGLPGVGKTELMKKLAETAGFRTVKYEQGNTNDRWIGQQEARIAQFFTDAINSSDTRPVFLLMDNIDVVCPRIVGDDIYLRRAVSVIREGIDELNRNLSAKVVLMGGTNYLTRIDPGIISKANDTLSFGLPNKTVRKSIIDSLFRTLTVPNETILNLLPDATVGWSPLAFHSFSKQLTERINPPGTAVLNDYFVQAFEIGRQALIDEYGRRGITIEPPKLVTNGADPLANLVVNEVVRNGVIGVTKYLRYPETYHASSPNFKRNTLLYGPPGTGKTSLAKAVANAACVMFIVFDAGAYVGAELIEKLREVFDLAKAYERAVIFIDEIDVIANQHSSARTILQTLMDGFKSMVGIVVIGATNYFGKTYVHHGNIYSNKIVSTIERRFQEFIPVPLPTYEERINLFNMKLSRIENVVFDIDLSAINLRRACTLLATESSEFSQSEISAVIEQAVAYANDRVAGTEHLASLSYNDVLAKVRRLRSIQEVENNPSPPQARFDLAPS